MDNLELLKVYEFKNFRIKDEFWNCELGSDNFIVGFMGVYFGVFFFKDQ